MWVHLSGESSLARGDPMSNPQGQDPGQSLERQPGESEEAYRERLQGAGAQGTEAPDAGENTGPQDR